MMCVLPLVSAASYCVCVAAGKDLSISMKVFLLQATLLFILAAVSAQLKFMNSLNSFVYFMENPRHSNGLLSTCVFISIRLSMAEVMMSCDNEEVLQISFEMFLSAVLCMCVLDEPEQLMNQFSCFCCFACGRFVWLGQASPAAFTSLRVCSAVLHAAGLQAMNQRTRCLHAHQKSLTAEILKQFAGLYENSPKQACAQQREQIQLRRRRYRSLLYLRPACGCDAAAIIDEIRKRRARCKTCFIREFLWKGQFLRQGWLTAEMLEHIQSFVEDDPQQVITYAGLLEDDGSSQISSIDSMERDSSDGSVGSSLSSVAALRRSVNDRLRHLACIPTPGVHLETKRNDPSEPQRTFPLLVKPLCMLDVKQLKVQWHAASTSQAS